MTVEQVNITLLVDNNVDPGMVREHGLSMWIEVRGDCILFDTGQGPALPLNAEALGVHLELANMLMLSHGHYDHTGGVSVALQNNPSLDVYCHPAAVQPRYSYVDGQARPIHMPPSAMNAINKVPFPKMHWVSGPEAVSGGIGLTGPIPRMKDNDGAGGPFYLDPGGIRPDPIDDDLALWIETTRGLVVCVGCCHAGLINTLDYICRLTGIDTIAAVIGGFHMMQSHHRHIERTISRLQQVSPHTIVPCHCTGEEAQVALSHAFPGRVIHGAAGLRLTF
jgi:7,8-dihydropterin-6-yl-methyl-4-(beta-D-ribofuranosyl)aminobenzene 5'-phosphate synthase